MAVPVFLYGYLSMRNFTGFCILLYRKRYGMDCIFLNLLFDFVKCCAMMIKDCYYSITNC